MDGLRLSWNLRWYAVFSVFTAVLLVTQLLIFTRSISLRFPVNGVTATLSEAENFSLVVEALVAIFHETVATRSHKEAAIDRSNASQTPHMSIMTGAPPH